MADLGFVDGGGGQKRLKKTYSKPMGGTAAWVASPGSATVL